MTAEATAPSVTVSVLTYRRPTLLADLLPTLLDQASEVVEAGTASAATVMVIDNDPDAGAADVAQAYPLVRYVHEPAPGIAAARNRALASARSRLLACIDDDERPEVDWLSALVTTWRGTGAALIAGRVVPAYLEAPDPWILAGGFFDRATRPTGSPLVAAPAGNLLLDLHQTRHLKLQFDPAFGMTGAEDTLFSRSMHRAGARLLWCDEARVIDQVPAHRLTRAWVLKRVLSHGNATVFVDLALTPTRAKRATVRVKHMLGGAARVPSGGVLWVYGLATHHLRRQARGARLAARGLGLFAGGAGLVYVEYARSGPRVRRWNRTALTTGASQ